ncbi:MAG: hypothetical protein Q4E24_11445 [bacterium]|nr:hypothetical protein [bacterium]
MTKKLITITVIALMSFSAIFTSFASINLNTNRQSHEDLLTQEPRIPHVCPSCQTDFMPLVCMNDENLKGTKTHKTSSGTCTYYQYSSRSVYICGSCGFAESVSGEHYCLDRHTVCSKGDYYPCPCDLRN